MPPGELINVGGLVRKDVAGYDLGSLLVGSEGTLGIVTAVSLRFVPAPEVALPLIATYADVAAGCEAIAGCLASGVVPAALEYLDAEAATMLRPTYPGRLGSDPALVVIAEADGSEAEASEGREALREALAPAAMYVEAPSDRREVQALWRWRDGVGLAAAAARGGKFSEDIVVPLDNLAQAIEATGEIALRHRVRSCGWGHAGDGNLHSTFLFSPEDESERRRALAASEELIGLALRLGGSISGEHGVGTTKTAHLGEQLGPGAVRLHQGVKDLFDPQGLLESRKKGHQNEGKMAVVTGAASGIGAAVSERLIAEGAHVVGADRDEGVCDASDKAFTAAVTDVSDEGSVVELIALAESIAPIDVLVNVAGIGSTTNAPDTPLEVWEAVFAVNARGTFLTCKHSIPPMAARGRGAIVNLASVAGQVGLRNRAAYCASKGAVIALTRALAVDHVGDGIRVNCICPGTVDSPWVRRLVEDSGESLAALRARQPMGRLGLPSEIAEAALYLADPVSGGFLTGSQLTVDGGLTAA